MRLTDRHLGKAAIHVPNQTEADFKRVDLECKQYMKLRDLENIEERIGVSLIELLKEPYCTIFIKKHHDRYGDKVNVDTIQEHTLYSIVPQEKCIYVTFENIKFYWKDYGKTWALTKEELE